MRILPLYYIFCIAAMLSMSSCNSGQSASDTSGQDSALSEKLPVDMPPVKPTIDTAEYLRLMTKMANGDTTGRWPPETAIPLPGALLPFNRIVAFYGNLYSTRMGILGELPKNQMLKKLQQEVNNWQKADSSIPVIPALHYIAVTAQASPGQAGKYRLRMPFHQIDTIVNWAAEIDALVFLDIQIGHSSLREEVPELEKYLKMPQVHLGIDPEFAMKEGHAPGKRIGSFDAAEINWVIDYLAGVVKENNLPPKVLVIHRFTRGMVTNYQKIKSVPEVQVAIDMDGWGPKHLKISTWNAYIFPEPIQFAGFKLFYKNDTKTGADQLFSPEELLKLVPQPMYIQYQ